MNLRTLLSYLEKYDASGNLDIDISGLAYDSRKIQPGYLFAALPGSNYHGAQFLAEAEVAGAAAILTNLEVQTEMTRIYVDSPRLALAILSDVYCGCPSQHLKLFGVTGTNGKTTSTFLLHSALKAAGIRSGLLGTVQYRGSQFLSQANLTTPESLDLQKMLAGMVAEQCGACVMEVSSHSLIQDRVGGCRFEAVIFTNLTQDHLDYHKTMEDYFQAKWMIFENEICKTETAVINRDDAYGLRILKQRKKLGLKAVSYGFEDGADYRITEWDSTPQGSELWIEFEDRGDSRDKILLKTPLIARFNAYNVCGVFAALHSCGISAEHIAAGVERMQQVPGRLERIHHGQPFLIFIDYAHTEDAMRQLLQTVRPYTDKKLVILFGCGGDRDRGKRPLMGEVAGQLADTVILTSDNPRREDPKDIIEDILTGVNASGNKNVHIILDRKEAIEFALKNLTAGDTLLLAGKGHENYQMIGPEKFHFDEREILAGYFAGAYEANR
ncbi:UDP-N-acetylmuramoyl-L-alanyl-D-glutamate--2,6-diaminopimelate ligase [bacterium]|nr:UDP-N-acetylmuramoyl-L-alanyl-D-glutamate--2,6-diaminopimelate ligase [bacterium]